MSIFDEMAAQLVKAGGEIAKAAEIAERTKEKLTLLTYSDLLRMKLSPADIKQIPTITPLGRSKPKYQAGDVQQYLDRRKKAPVGV